MGWIHANVARLWREQAGQGTVEYVGLMLLLASLLAGAVALAKGAGDQTIADAIAEHIKKAIAKVTSTAP